MRLFLVLALVPQMAIKEKRYLGGGGRKGGLVYLLSPSHRKRHGGELYRDEWQNSSGG